MAHTVTLMVAGKPLTFTPHSRADSRVEGCLPPHVPAPRKGPCPKHGIKKAAKGIGKAIKRAEIKVPDSLKGGEHEKAAQAAARARIAKQLVLRMAAGEKFEVDEGQVPDIMGFFHDNPDAPPMNLALMQVKGKPNLFQHHLRDIPREKMPALPDTVDGMGPLIVELRRRGVKVELIDVHPSEIQATQSQLSAAKVAKMAAGYMRQGWKPGGAVILSREKALGDGHHRWAGAAVADTLHRQGAPGYEKPVVPKALQVDLPIDELLAVMEEFSGAKKGLDEKP